MEKIAHRTGENKGAAPYPSLSGPPALQRKRDRTGELVDDDPPAVDLSLGYPSLFRSKQRPNYERRPPGVVGMDLAAELAEGRHRGVALGIMAAVEATGIDPVLDLKMLLTAVRELQRRGAE